MSWSPTVSRQRAGRTTPCVSAVPPSSPKRPVCTPPATGPQPTTPGQLRVAFTNNAIDQGQDRNVWIDRIELNNQTYESEHPTVTSQGAWANGANCRPGTYNTEFLACNGWFQYADLE